MPGLAKVEEAVVAGCSRIGAIFAQVGKMRPGLVRNPNTPEALEALIRAGAGVEALRRNPDWKHVADYMTARRALLTNGLISEQEMAKVPALQAAVAEWNAFERHLDGVVAQGQVAGKHLEALRHDSL